MDEAETKTCTNCKREIPAVNFTIHTVHCARNIKICPVCKEPIPQAELQEHHEKLHKLLPCKKCGESVCGTDLEDHVRDSCAHTIKSCRFCELELPRRELPAHEGYCGVRTEQCADCREWVMIKYRQLHRDSNHGFLRLDDDPVPKPKKEPVKTQRTPNPVNQPQPPAAALSRFLNGPSSSASNGNILKNINYELPRPRPEFNFPAAASPSAILGSFVVTPADAALDPVDILHIEEDRPRSNRPRPGLSGQPAPGGSRAQENQRLPFKRTNDQPQININVAATEKVNKDLGISRGAVKKRQAPQPPAPDPRRDRAYYGALQRQQAEERQRQEQTAINLAQGLPPVLSPAAKLERLRKMDALHHRETAPPPRPPPHQDLRREFRDLKPMNPEEFMRRFQSLNMERRDDGGGNGEALGHGDRGEAGRGRGDRFSEIKSSLMALRRGLNEVTAPYNAWNEGETTNSRVRVRDVSPSSSSSSSSSSRSGEDEPVRLPCEFCARPILCEDLVVHQTGCRPDLAQLKSRDGPPANRPHQRHQHRQQQQYQQQQQLNHNLPPHPDDLPVIPCEFCTESLPVYLISEHQERCRREGPMVYPD